jgi:uncharacterized membrane protein YqhA
LFIPKETPIFVTNVNPNANKNMAHVEHVDDYGQLKQKLLFGMIVVLVDQVANVFNNCSRKVMAQKT